MKTNFEINAPGQGTIVIDLLASKVYNVENDIFEMKDDFGEVTEPGQDGMKVYHTSRSGMSKAGFIRHHPTRILIPLKTGICSELDHPKFGLVKYQIGYQFGNQRCEFPSLATAYISISKQKEMYVYVLKTKEELLHVLQHGVISEGLIQKSRYNYYARDLGVAKYEVNWIQEGVFEERNRPEGIGYFEFWRTVSWLQGFPDDTNTLSPRKFCSDRRNSHPYPFIYQNAKIRIGHGTAYAESQGLIPDTIGEISELGRAWGEAAPYFWKSGWATFHNFAWKVQNVAHQPKTPGSTRVYAIYETENRELSERLPEGYTEYEQYFDVFEWASKTPNEHRADMRKKAFEKAIYRFIYSQKIKRENKNRKDEVFRILNENAEVFLTVQDSYNVGNCQPGTEDFMNRFSLTNTIPCGDLLKHKSIEEISNSTEFQNVIFKKFGVSVRDPKRKKEAYIVDEEDIAETELDYDDNE